MCGLFVCNVDGVGFLVGVFGVLCNFVVMVDFFVFLKVVVLDYLEKISCLFDVDVEF